MDMFVTCFFVNVTYVTLFLHCRKMCKQNKGEMRYALCLFIFFNRYIFNSATYATLIFQQRLDTPWFSIDMVNALNRTKVRGVIVFFLFLMVTY